MKILFLDMDGVVNSARFFDVSSKRQYRKARGAAKERGRSFGTFVDMIDSDAVPLLNAIVERTGCKVVISSSWRIPWSYPAIGDMLDECGFIGEVIGATPNGVLLEPDQEPARGHEIQAWLNEHPEVTSFVILDDCSDMAHLMPRLVRTTWAEGLQPHHVELVVELFNGKETT